MHLSAQDLKYSSSTIQADLDRFQRQKVADIREMAISMAKSHRDWCKKVSGEYIRFYVVPLIGSCLTFLSQNLEAWEEAKREVEKIPDHPNRMLEETVEDSGGVANGSRESTSTIDGH